MTSVLAHRDHLSEAARLAVLPRCRGPRRVLPGRSACSAGPVRAALPPDARDAAVENLPRGRLRPRREPRLEPRPVAARGAALPAAPAALHGEVGAVLARPRPDPAGGGAFPVRRGEADTEAIDTAVELVPRRARSSSCSRRDAAPRGPAQEVRGAAAHGAARIALDAGRRSCPPRSRHRPARPARPAPRRLRPAGPARRPRPDGRARGASSGDRPADGRDRRLEATL